jgi:hypothetical protein
MRRRPLLRPLLTATVALVGVALAVPLTAGSASAHTRGASAHQRTAHAAMHRMSALSGGWVTGSRTVVTTAPGIASTLIGAGVVPLPVWPKTGFRIGSIDPLKVSYAFPITGSTADLANGTGDITHSGGIAFYGKGKSLEIGKFDIDLAAGKVFATEINHAPGRIAVLDLNLAHLTVTTEHHSTVLSGISVKLDGAAAGALNSTFGLGLPTDGSLLFGFARVVIKG